MSELSIKIICVVLSFCIFVPVTHGREGCNCRCSVPHYGELNVCAWLNSGSPKVDSNTHEINYLKNEIRKFSIFKDYFEKKMTEEVWSFIETITAQSAAQKTSEYSNTNANEPLVDLAAEISMLKKQFKEERDELEAKIEQRDKNSLSITDNLFERVSVMESRVVQSENAMLERINKTEEQTLKMGDEILFQVNKNEVQNSKIKVENLQKFNETENQITNLSRDLYSKIENMVSETFKLKDEFLLQANKQKSQTASARLELLLKVNDLENHTLKIRGEILEKIDEKGIQIFHDLNSKIKGMESETSKLKDEFRVQANEQKNQTATAGLEFLEKINDLENDTLKIRGEILEKINETGIQISDLSDDLNLKIKGIESETSKLKDEFRVQANEQKSQTSRAKNELLVEIDNLKKETSNVKDNFLLRTTQLERKISNAKQEVLSKIDETVTTRNLQLKGEFSKKVTEIEENSSRQRRALKTDVEQVENLVRNEMATQQTKWIRSEAKTNKIEEVVKELRPKDISSNISSIWHTVSEIRTDANALQNNVNGMHDKTSEIWTNISVIWSSVQPIQPLKTLKEQETCVNVLPPSDTIPAAGKIFRSETESLFQVLQAVQFQSPAAHAPPSYFSCYGVVIRKDWLVVSSRCLEAGRVSMYGVTFWARFHPGEYQYTPYLYSENQLCSTCMRSDIGLMKIKGLKEKKYSCLLTHKIRDQVFGSAIFLGWKRYRSEGTMHNVNIIPDDECSKAYSLFDSSMFCTQYDEHALRTCKNDNAGLLFKNYHGNTVLVGMVENCGSDGQPIVYKGIADFSSWIYTFTKRMDNKG